MPFNLQRYDTPVYVFGGTPSTNWLLLDQRLHVSYEGGASRQFKLVNEPGLDGGVRLIADDDVMNLKMSDLKMSVYHRLQQVIPVQNDFQAWVHTFRVIRRRLMFRSAPLRVIETGRPLTLHLFEGYRWHKGDAFIEMPAIEQVEYVTGNVREVVMV